MNAWLWSLALLHVIAEHALRNAVSPELEIWYRDLCVTSQSTGHLCKARRGEGLCSTSHTAGQKSQAVVRKEVQKEKAEGSLEPKVTQATRPVAFQGRAS